MGLRISPLTRKLYIQTRCSVPNIVLAGLVPCDKLLGYRRYCVQWYVYECCVCFCHFNLVKLFIQIC